MVKDGVHVSLTRCGLVELKLVLKQRQIWSPLIYPYPFPFVYIDPGPWMKQAGQWRTLITIYHGSLLCCWPSRDPSSPLLWDSAPGDPEGFSRTGLAWGTMGCRMQDTGGGWGTLFSAVAALLHFSPIPWLWLRDSLSPHIPPPRPHQLTWLPFQPSASHVVGAQAGLGRLEAGCSHFSLPCWAKYGWCFPSGLRSTPWKAHKPDSKRRREKGT